jgi:hypothetical protein
MLHGFLSCGWGLQAGEALRHAGEVTLLRRFLCLTSSAVQRAAVDKVIAEPTGGSGMLRDGTSPFYERQMTFG